MNTRIHIGLVIAGLSFSYVAEAQADNAKWAGVYIGVNAGYGWGSTVGTKTSFTDPNFEGNFAIYQSVGGFRYPNLRPEGALGGGQIGYTALYSANWVWGAVADIQRAAIKDGGSVSVPEIIYINTPSALAGFFPQQQSQSVEIEWLGTVRGRVGHAWDRLQLYATGGLAYGIPDNSVTQLVVTNGFTLNGRNRKLKWGWTAGVGVEREVGQWLLALEYLYFDLGQTRTTAEPLIFLPAAAGVSVSIDQRLAGHIARVVLSYRLGAFK